MPSWGELEGLERQLRASIVALNREVGSIALIEAVDHVDLWQGPFGQFCPVAPEADLDKLMLKVPLLSCAIAAEIGFRFEGVGTVFWSKLADALGFNITMAQRARLVDCFAETAKRHQLIHPSQSAFSSHFSIISWPIANALLPVDLVGSVTRLTARAPVTALPGVGRTINFPSLRAWASAAEGARLTDWLRFEEPTTRVLTALLTDNRNNTLPEKSFARLKRAISENSESFFAMRAGRVRARSAKAPTAGEQTLGRLSLVRDGSNLRLLVTWPPLPPALLDDARTLARSGGWRPNLWNAGAFLHPDTALSPGPFVLSMPTPPSDEAPAYPNSADVFGGGSEIATALAARTVAWSSTLLFDVDDNRAQAEQRLADTFEQSSGTVWIATRTGGTNLAGLRKIGNCCSYTVFEGDLANAGDRAILSREGLLSAHNRLKLARHPIDAIGAARPIVRPGRSFLIYRDDDGSAHLTAPQRLSAGGRLSAGASPAVRAEAKEPSGDAPITATLFERNTAFEALVERRLQLRVEASLPLRDVPVHTELEIGGRLIARGHDRLSSLPVTVDSTSPLLANLYDDAIRTRLIESGKGLLRVFVGRSVTLTIPLNRPAATVQWTNDTPQLDGVSLETALVGATARRPHRFDPAPAVSKPRRGAIAYGLETSDGRVVDPLQVFTSETFDLGDLDSHFGDDLGTRRVFDAGRGVGDFARARVAWARALCMSLPSIAAKVRVLRQFEEPLVIDLCGKSWLLAERSTASDPTDAHDAIWNIAIERGLITLHPSIGSIEAGHFASAFRRHAVVIDSAWPTANPVPADGAMDDALNIAFSETIAELHANGVLLDVEDDFDFGSPMEDWEKAAERALHQIQRRPLVKLLAPTAGGQSLARRSYSDLSVAELAEDLAAWTRAFALSRGQLSPEAAAAALQLWLYPSNCDEVDSVARILAVDPFVSRATRYAALRLAAATSGAAQ